jgi:hypothetical protein
MLMDLASHMLTFEKVAVQPARAMVAAWTYCRPNSQILVVKRTISLQDLNVGLYVLTPFRHIISSSDTQFYSPQDMFSYCKISAFVLGSLMLMSFELDGIAGSITIGVINYALLGFQFPVDDFYMHSFEIWLATTVVFFGSGNVGFTLLEYRLGEKELVWHS